jgi:hypothetical protein
VNNLIAVIMTYNVHGAVMKISVKCLVIHGHNLAGVESVVMVVVKKIILLHLLTTVHGVNVQIMAVAVPVLPILLMILPKQLIMVLLFVIIMFPATITVPQEIVMEINIQ